MPITLVSPPIIQSCVIYATFLLNGVVNICIVLSKWCFLNLLELYLFTSLNHHATGLFFIIDNVFLFTFALL